MTQIIALATAPSASFSDRTRRRMAAIRDLSLVAAAWGGSWALTIGVGYGIATAF